MLFKSAAESSGGCSSRTYYTPLLGRYGPGLFDNPQLRHSSLAGLPEHAHVTVSLATLILEALQGNYTLHDPDYRSLAVGAAPLCREPSSGAGAGQIDNPPRGNLKRVAGVSPEPATLSMLGSAALAQAEPCPRDCSTGAGGELSPRGKRRLGAQHSAYFLSFSPRSSDAFATS